MTVNDSIPAWRSGPVDGAVGRRGAARPDLHIESAGGGAAGSVILVDDDLDVAEMYRLGLESLGFSVIVAGNSTQLFLAIDAHVPDIIVLDWELPGMRGDEILQQIRLDQRTAALPVLMLSGFPATMDGAVDRVFLAGALAWLEKTKTPPTLLAAKLTEALRRKSPDRSGALEA